jgi:hypothetical protein
MSVSVYCFSARAALVSVQDHRRIVPVRRVVGLSGEMLEPHGAGWRPRDGRDTRGKAATDIRETGSNGHLFWRFSNFRSAPEGLAQLLTALLASRVVGPGFGQSMAANDDERCSAYNACRTLKASWGRKMIKES